MPDVLSKAILVILQDGLFALKVSAYKKGF